MDDISIVAVVVVNDDDVDDVVDTDDDVDDAAVLVDDISIAVVEVDVIVVVVNDPDDVLLVHIDVVVSHTVPDAKPNITQSSSLEHGNKHIPSNEQTIAYPLAVQSLIVVHPEHT